MSRRAFLGHLVARAGACASAVGAFAALGRDVRADEGDLPAHAIPPPAALRFDLLEWPSTAMFGWGSGAVVATPRDLAPGELLPLVVLLPGGHHTMQPHATGRWGWWSDYGLGDTDAALRRGSLREGDFQGLVRASELEAFNVRLEDKPYRGAVYVTPWVVGRQADPALHGVAISQFLRDLVDEVRGRFPVLPTRAATGLGGMSTGGLWAIYCGAACADLFGTIVATQPFTEELVRPLREAVLARSEEQVLRLTTSVGDHQRDSTLALVAALRNEGVRIELEEYLGGHSGAFAMGPGGLDALLRFDRALRGESFDGTRPLPPHDGVEALVDPTGEGAFAHRVLPHERIATWGGAHGLAPTRTPSVATAIGMATAVAAAGAMAAHSWLGGRGRGGLGGREPSTGATSGTRGACRRTGRHL